MCKYCNTFHKKEFPYVVIYITKSNEFDINMYLPTFQNILILEFTKSNHVENCHNNLNYLTNILVLVMSNNFIQHIKSSCFGHNINLKLLKPRF